ncbi:hypothetical protein LZ318_30690 [Saccharopolyspora indica]|uniref:hypothetical protein n=1 Tax=Saccharopolyspora indica TaxID=1229659 RepID=UPI0022EB663F|nr:hypothetical protein [Saccharopolyspora indica]MDA3644400.1 hypothetical protein [Saccharopolyspora indica]
MMQHFADTALMLLAQGEIPNPAPIAPPGSDKITSVLGNVKWGAAIALMIGFFVGLTVWVGGRWVDHHRAGKIGVIMMLCAIFGGLFYGLAHQLVSHFAGVA